MGVGNLAQIDWSLTIGLLGTVIGVVGIVIAFVLHFRARRVPRPLYAVRTNVVVDPSEETALEVRFLDKPIPRASRSVVRIWNAGRGTMRTEDIPPKDRVRIRLWGGVDILTVGIDSSSLANEAAISPPDDNGWLTVAFRYLDPGQFIVAEILHTGDAFAEVEVAGSCMGVGSLAPFRPRSGLLFVGAAVAVLAAIPLNSFLERLWSGDIEGKIATGGIVLVLAAIVIWILDVVEAYVDRVEEFTGMNRLL